MYEEFFGLRARPFAITPSVDLFFHSEAHREALACLRRQVLMGEPLVVLTGEIGAGKTTVLHALWRELPAGQFARASLVSTQLDDLELTRAVLLAFGVSGGDGETLASLRASLRSHLEALHAEGRRGLLVVDEAQNFPAETLRYLRQLPSLGATAERPLLQAIVAGQPSLETILAQTGDSTADLLCRLGRMSPSDTASYVRHRLRVAGTAGGPTFSEGAFDQIRVTTGGLPRLVNRLCDRVLLSASFDRTRQIDQQRVASAAAELRDEIGPVDPTSSPPEREPAHEGRPDGKPPPATIPPLEAPVLEAPVLEAPAHEAPAHEAPAHEAPGPEAPDPEAPGVEAPRTEAPDPEAPFLDTLPPEPRSREPAALDGTPLHPVLAEPRRTEPRVPLPQAEQHPPAAAHAVEGAPSLPPTGGRSFAPVPRNRRHVWAAAGAAVLLVTTVAWLATDRPASERLKTSASRTATSVVTPASEATAPAAPVPVPPASSTPATPSPATPAVEAGAEPAIDARQALGLAPPAASAAVPQPRPDAACSEAAKILGLCP